MIKNSDEETIVAVSTPVGEGGIGIVRLSGRSSIKIADKIFVSSDGRKPSKYKTHTIHYGYIAERPQVRCHKSQVKMKNAKCGRKKPKFKTDKFVDEVLLTLMRAPRTYTKEDIVEINCHGGMTALRKVLELAAKNGARLAEPGEFTKRAFLNGRLDLTQAEAVLDIIRAKTETGLRVSLNQLEGDLSREIRSARELLIDVCADVEVSIDFPEEDIETDAVKSWLKKIGTAKKRLQGLLDTYHDGSILKDGITTVICGRANVGKSSLMNLLLKKERVIVTDIPGTTRDAIEEMVNIEGIPIRLVDTAGLIRNGDVIEKAGIDKSRLYLSRADLILCVLDGSERLKRDDIELLNEVSRRPTVIVVNKSDLGLVLDMKEVKKRAKNRGIVKISCLEKEGIDKLENKIYNKIWSGKVRTSHELILNNVRHKNAIEKAIGRLCDVTDAIRRRLSLEFLAIDIRESINALGEIVGETCSDDILDVIFSNFCIGK